MTSNQRLEVSPKKIHSFVKDITSKLHETSLDKSVLFDIRLCLEEALVNAAKHGNRDKEDLPINIDYTISDQKFQISIEDCGEGFDHKKLPNCTAKENILKTRGRGVYLIKHLMDEVTFNDTGNRITMVKYLKGGSCS